MKLKLNYFILPLLLFVGYFLMQYSMPQYAGQYLFMVVLVLADFYLWSSVKKQVFNYRHWLRVLIIFVYWLPLLLLAVLIVGSVIVPVINWNDIFRTYMVAVILIFYTAKILPITFLVLADIVRVIQKLFIVGKKDGRQKIKENGETEGISRSRFLQYVGFISGGLVLGSMFVGMFKWAYEFKIVREKIIFPNLSKEFNGFKIVQISDIHLGTWTSKKPLQRAVDMINELNPDVILFTGDLVNYATNETIGFEDILSQLKAKYGVFAILGNHDYGNYVTWPSEKAKQENMNQLYDFFENVGWRLLNTGGQI